MMAEHLYPLLYNQFNFLKTVTGLLLIIAVPFWVSLVEQVSVAIWKLSLVTGITPEWWNCFPVCFSFSSTSPQVAGRLR